MFEIAEGDLPVVPTRQALLVLDLQNDLVSTGGILFVDKPADFVDRIVNLVPQFRRAGNVIWVRSQFKTHRPVNDGNSDSDRVITDNELPSGSTEDAGFGNRQRRPSKSLQTLYEKMRAKESLEGAEPSPGEADDQHEEPFDNETYLSPGPGKEVRCLIPLSSGANYPQSIAQLIDLSKDVFFTKADYSSFKSGALLQTLRGQFVTELFICGALTNISVFATAMDAARFGYSITLVEDCLGYRSKARHDEALKQMVEATGCEVMSSSEVIEGILAKESSQSRPPNAGTPVRDTRDLRNLQQMMTNLKIRNETSESTPAKSSSTVSPPAKPKSRYSSESSDKPLESLQPIPAASDEPPQDILPPPKSESEGRKRVANKIKIRRPLSKANSEKRGLDIHKAMSSGPSKSAKPPVSPTQATLTSASELLEKTPTPTPMDKDSNALATTTMTQQLEPDNNSVAGSQPDSKVKPDIRTAVTEATDVKFEGSNDATVRFSKNPKCEPSAFEPHSDAQDDSSAICEGDSRIVHSLLPGEVADGIFEQVRDEVRWQKMSHQGGEVPRLVAVQGEIAEDGSIPIYRHPADESPPLLPFTPTVSVIRSVVEKKLGHKVNHCLIQFYRSGTDYISEHSDKTLDIAPNTFIANVSLGALRVMTFRTKKPLKDQEIPHNEENTLRLSYKAPLPHNSMCKMGLRTNMKWLHSIRQDKRRLEEKSEAELAYNGRRISLTFRYIGTFLNRDQTKIWGQGAVAKEKGDARTVINGETPEAEKMLQAFGKENHYGNFDWQESYGHGFDVLHISNARKLFLSGDATVDLRVKLILAELELSWMAGELSPFFNWKQESPRVDAPEIPEVFPIRFVDNDLSRATVQGDLAILLYLDASYGPGPDIKSQIQKARQFTRLQESNTLLQKCRAEAFRVKRFRRLLALWDIFASEDLFIAGPIPSVADYAFWPVLHEIVKEWGDGIDSPNLEVYYDRMLKRESVQKVLAAAESKT